MLSKTALHAALVVVAVIVAAFNVTGSAQQRRAAALVVPAADPATGICAPFGCNTRMQQVFDRELFPTGIRIEALEFFHTNGSGFVEPARYRFTLSTTEVSSTTMSRTFSANLGARRLIVAERVVDDFNTFFTRLTIPLNPPYVYHPSQGNLLLEIQKDRTANHGDGVVYADGSVSASGVALLTDTSFHPQVGLSVGFVGQFVGKP